MHKLYSNSTDKALQSSENGTTGNCSRAGRHDNTTKDRGDEDDDDCLGFGSFNDVFSGGVPVSRSSMDWDILKEFMVSGNDMKQIVQFIKNQKFLQRYRHIALRCEGRQFPGGLGDLYVAPTSIIWLQASYSDVVLTKQEDSSTARASFSEKALNVMYEKLLSVRSSQVQGKAASIHLEISANETVIIEFAFMPGPYQKPTNADAFFRHINEKIGAGTSQQSTSKENTKPSRHIYPKSNDENKSHDMNALCCENSSVDSLKQIRVKANDDNNNSSRGGNIDCKVQVPARHEVGAGCDSSSSSGAIRDLRQLCEYQRTPLKSERKRGRNGHIYERLSDECYELVSKYLSLSPYTDEAFSLAKKIKDLCGYSAGPTSANPPSMKTDMAERKRRSVQLIEMLENMKAAKEADVSERESSTRARFYTDDDGFLAYRDIDSNAKISVMEYEIRYKKFIAEKLKEKIQSGSDLMTALHARGLPDIDFANDDKFTGKCSDAVRPISNAPPPSVIILPEIPENASATQREHLIKMKLQTEQELECAQKSLWASWDKSFMEYVNRAQMIRENFEAQLSTKGGSSECNDPNESGLVAGASCSSSTSPKCSDVTNSDENEMRGLKRSRRKSRRCSILNPSSVTGQQLVSQYEEGDDTESKEADASVDDDRSPKASRKSRRNSRRHSIIDPSLVGLENNNLEYNGNDEFHREDSVESDSDNTATTRSICHTDLGKECKLCYDRMSDVSLEPCGHKICQTCINRLKGSSNEQSLRCPWDRTVVSVCKDL